MKRIYEPALLMVVTILVITGFQTYWLRQNYVREKKALQARTDMLFRESVFALQASKLKLDAGSPSDTGKKQISITLRNTPGEQFNLPTPPAEGMVSMVNILREKVSDSSENRSGMIIALNESSVQYHPDSVRKDVNFSWKSNGDRIVQFLYGIDSLQDSLRVRDVDSAFSQRLKQENMVIPYSVRRLAENKMPGKVQQMNEVTVGFTKPVTFRMETGNTFPYLFKRILSPLVFSFFLVGVTLLSFVLLYRGLLQQRRLTALKNDFISNMTHELKTPIATVNVAIEALRNFNAISDPEKTREYLDISHNELHRLSLLVDKVLKLSLFESREVELNLETFDLVSLAEEVAGSFRLQFEKKSASLDFRREGGDFILEADRMHMTSVIYNLLDNALKYTDKKPEINLTVRGYETRLELEVSDNGRGISPEYREKIFDKFFRVPQGDRHDVKGHGLGLSYVAHIVKKHNGTIEVVSEENRGSTFRISLPRRHG
jgi:two-component system phosphate regulon sensor histidine kinase PhoR